MVSGFPHLQSQTLEQSQSLHSPEPVRHSEKTDSEKMVSKRGTDSLQYKANPPNIMLSCWSWYHEVPEKIGRGQKPRLSWALHLEGPAK